MKNFDKVYSELLLEDRAKVARRLAWLLCDDTVCAIEQMRKRISTLSKNVSLFNDDRASEFSFLCEVDEAIKALVEDYLDGLSIDHRA